MFHIGEELGVGGAQKGSLPGKIDSGSGPTTAAASSSRALADDDDADRPVATVGETDTSSANPEANPEGKSFDSADCAGDISTRDVPTGTAPARGEPATTGASRPTSEDKNDQNLEEAAQTEERPTAATILTRGFVQSTGVGGCDDAGDVPIEAQDEQTNQEVWVADAAEAAAGGEGTNVLPQVCAESTSGSGTGESSGGRPGSAGDSSCNMKKMESRAELDRPRSASKVSRKASKRNVSSMSRRSCSGGGGVVEPPANTPHLQV